MHEFSIYWGDLTQECQNRLSEFLGEENGNFDVFPITTILNEEDEEYTPKQVNDTRLY